MTALYICFHSTIHFVAILNLDRKIVVELPRRGQPVRMALKRAIQGVTAGAGDGIRTHDILLGKQTLYP